MLKYFSSKTYTHAQGLSCCFRQWRATHSHCSKLHGYAIEVKLMFTSTKLDNRNWVMDFGGLKAIKEMLVNTFDHKTIMAHDDPLVVTYLEMQEKGLIDLFTMENVGCEAFAKFIWDEIQDMRESGEIEWPFNVELRSVEVREHDGNSAGVVNMDV